MLGRSGDIPSIFTELIILCRVEAVAAYDLAVATGRHNDLVDAKTTPILDGFVRDIIVESEGAQFIGPDDAAVAT